VPTGLTFSGLVTSGLFLSTAESPVAAGIGATYNTQVDFFNIPGLGAPVGISSTPQPVFSLEFEVGADVADGTVFVIDILGDGETSPNNIFSATDGQENEVGNVETGGGTITIVNNANVVPEPTAGVLLLVGGGLAALRRRKR